MSDFRRRLHRFISLVRKYRNISELTDEMLFEYVDRIVVHAPTGGRGIYRQQKLDIYFNFIGNYLPPMPELTEGECRAAAETAIEAKKEARRKQKAQNRKAKQTALKKAIKADPEAAVEYEAKLAAQRERKRSRREQEKARREVDPEYQVQQKAKSEERKRKSNERYHRNYVPIAELEMRAETDPKAAEELRLRREKQAEKNRLNKERREERMAQDPEYAEKIRRKKDEQNKARSVRRKAEREALIERARTDPEAAAELKVIRAKACEASKRSRQKKLTQTGAGSEYPTAEKGKEKKKRL